jgi:hypothetical protein
VDVARCRVSVADETGPVLVALDERRLSAAEHLADAAYVSADLLVSAEDRYGVRLVGPPRKDVSWQARAEGGYTTDRFDLDWGRETATCPEGEESWSWRTYTDRDRGEYIVAQFAPGACQSCAARDLCVRSKSGGRTLRLHPERGQAALEAMRVEMATDEGRDRYAARAGVEGTLSQGIRAMGLRRSRYRGLDKTRLGHVATAAALSIDRTAAWLRGRPLAATRTSRFAALAV